MIRNTLDTVRFLLFSYIFHVISSAAIVYLYYSHGIPEHVQTIFNIFLLMEIVSLILVGNQVRDLYYDRYPQKTLTICFSIIYMLIGLGLLSFSTYQDNFGSLSLFSSYTISALVLFVSAYFIRPTVRIQKPEQSLSELLKKQPQDLVNVLKAAIVLSLLYEAITIWLSVHYSTTNFSLTLNGVSDLIVFERFRLLYYVVLMVGLYRGSQTSALFLYHLKWLLCLFYLINIFSVDGYNAAEGYKVAQFPSPLIFHLPDTTYLTINLIFLAITVGYLVRVKSFFQSSDVQSWFDACDLARKAKCYK